MSNNYWPKRSSRNAFNKADKFEKQLIKTYRQAFKSIDAQLKDIWLEMLSNGGEISQTALYQNNRLRSLMEFVGKQLNELGVYTNNNLQLSLLDIYRDGYSDAAEQLSNVAISFSLLNEQVAKEVVNASYKNARYSERVWENLSSIRSQIERAIIDTAITGQDYKKASRALANRMSISLSDARRIVVTETARVHSEATRNGALDKGYKSYHILLEADACEECKELSNRHFSLLRNDVLPAHPHCRCCMVVDLDNVDEIE